VQLKLTENMRLRRHGISEEEGNDIRKFAEWLTEVGSGRCNDSQGFVNLPPFIRLSSPDDGISALKERTYGNVWRDEYLNGNEEFLEWFSKRALLAGKNTDVNAVNAEMLAKLPGESICFKSADCIPRTEEHDYRGPDMPIEYLNALEFPGLPLHETELKVGAPIMLMRNLDPGNGLCNGTRLLVMALGSRVIKAKVITGDARNQIVLIPRIALDCDENVSEEARCTMLRLQIWLLQLSLQSIPFILRRLQFPVKLAFALTINKSQGQSLESVGLDLSSSVFAHRQLYVALSRATSSHNISILLPREHYPQRKTPNVVYRQVIV
jgi:hypothetical protein